MDMLFLDSSLAEIRHFGLGILFQENKIKVDVTSWEGNLTSGEVAVGDLHQTHTN